MSSCETIDIQLNGRAVSKPNNQCYICKEVFVVDSLARCCEMKHDGVVFIKPVYVAKPWQKPIKPKNDKSESDSD